MGPFQEEDRNDKNEKWPKSSEQKNVVGRGFENPAKNWGGEGCQKGKKNPDVKVLHGCLGVNSGYADPSEQQGVEKKGDKGGDKKGEVSARWKVSVNPKRRSPNPQRDLAEKKEKSAMEEGTLEVQKTLFTL